MAEGERPAERQADLGETIAVYDADAASFADFQWRTADFGAYLDRFLALVPFGPEPVIDAGCGGGRDAAAMAARGYHVIGVDMSARLLAEAKARCADPKARFVLGDIRRLPLPDGCARGVWSNSTLLHLDAEGRGGAVREFRRVLVPGGALFITTSHGAGRRLPRPSATPGLSRWYYETGQAWLEEVVAAAGFRVALSKVEPGIVSGEWLNLLATAV